ncbi:MAG: hypothetical protein AAGI01_08870 [Myxococcota bacterium]
MYEATLWAHSLLRYVLLIAGFAAIILSLKGWLTQQDFKAHHRRIHAAFLGSMHLELVLGLLLYVGLSPLAQAAFRAEDTMKNPLWRFWAVEHITTMIFAAIVTHASFVLVQRAEEDAQKFKRAAIGFSLAMALVFTAIPWPFREVVGRGWLPGL